MTSLPQQAANKKNNQRGVTLLLSILILASITAIVFAVASLAVNETRTSGDLIRSEPAITAAEAGAEDVLYYAIRGVGSYSTNCSAPSTATVNGVNLKYCLNPYLNNPFQFALPGGPPAEKDYFLYNATSQGAAPGYTSISVTLNSGIGGQINICSWTNTSCKSAPDVATLTPTTGQTQSATLNPNISIGYQLIFLNSNTITDVFTVTTAPQGIPSGTATIETIGSNGGVTRKLQTVLPQ